MDLEKNYEIEISAGDFEEVDEPLMFSVDDEIFRQARVLSIDDKIMIEVHELYEYAKSRGLTKYKQKEKVITALIYVVCRQDGIPLTLHKICDSLKIDYRSINKVYRYLIKKMGINIPATTPDEYVKKFAEELELPKKTINKAAGILKSVRGSGCISGKGPAGVAAATLCLACGMEDEVPRQKEIARVSGVTQVTIRNRCREMEESLGMAAE